MGDAFEWYTGHSIHCEEWGGEAPLAGPASWASVEGYSPQNP